MENAPTDLTTVNSSVEWVLPILQRAASDRRTPNVTTGTLSEETRKLLDKESRVPKKV